MAGLLLTNWRSLADQLRVRLTPHSPNLSSYISSPNFIQSENGDTQAYYFILPSSLYTHYVLFLELTMHL